MTADVCWICKSKCWLCSGLTAGELKIRSSVKAWLVKLAVCYLHASWCFWPCSRSRWWSRRGQKAGSASCILSLRQRLNGGWFYQFLTPLVVNLSVRGSTHLNHMHKAWPCFLCHIMFMQPALTSPITSSLLSPYTLCFTPPPPSPVVKIYWCPLMFSVPGFLPGNSYCWCF